MKNNWFAKFLCVNLSLCIALSNVPLSPVQTDVSHVYAAEIEGETEITEVEGEAKEQEPETQEVLETQALETDAFETEALEEQETEAAATETVITETVKAEEINTETEEVTQETETLSETTLETEAALETGIQIESVFETDDAAYVNSLLEKLKEKYSTMYINNDGYFEYTDENGLVHTYDPYDPELYKNLIENDNVPDEYNTSSDINQYNADSSSTTVSPFTNKTYTHENHVSNKIVRHGIDVSKYQGDIDWEKAKKAGVYFAFIRVGYRGYGDDGKIAGDEYAKENIKEAHDAGIKVGVYFFSQAITEPEASEEAEYCIKFLKDNNLKDYISLPVVIDYEYTSGDTKGRLEKADLSKSKHQKICDRFVQDVRDEGYKGGIYANYSMLKNDMNPTSSSIYSKTYYWIARYNNTTGYDDDYRFWQYSSQGKVSGISGRVDCNFWYEDKKKITDCRISIDTETDYVDDIREALCVYNTSQKYELVEGTDYEVTVDTQTVDGKVVYQLIINGIGEYEGKVERSVTMTQLTLSEAMISDIAAQEYTGLEITQETGLKIEINNGGARLKEGTDYTVSYADNINAGTGYVIVTGMGNYTGEVRKSFQITGMKLTAEMFEDIPDLIYTGAELKTDNGVIISGTNKNIDYQLTEGVDYTLKYSANKNAGPAKVTVSGKGNYAGEVTLTFNILSRDFTDMALVSIGGTYDTYEAVYTGKALKPNITVVVDGQTLSKSDYTVEYGDNINIGTEAYVIVKGKRNYTGEVKKYFTITQKAAKQTKLTSKMVSLRNTHMYTANGEPIQPALYVVSGTRLLERDVDYSVLYQNKNGSQLSQITDAGVYKIIVSGIGQYTGKVTKNLTVISENDKALNDTLTEVTLVSENESLVYTGKAVTPQIKVVDKVNGAELVLGKDYKVSYTDNKTAGTARIVIKGKGDYKGETTTAFDILPKNLGNIEQGAQGQPIVNGSTTINLNKYSYVYNGKRQQPKLTVKDDKKTLKENKDFKVTYSGTDSQQNAASRINADKYTISITFIGNYAGTAVMSYEITPADLGKLKVKVDKQLYTGSSICPGLDDMVIKLGSAVLDDKALEGVSIEDWSNNTAVGTAGFYLQSTEESKNFIIGQSKNVTFKIVKKAVKDKELAITVGGFAVSDDNSCALELVYNDGIEYNQTNGAEVIIKDISTDTILEENKDYTVKFTNNKNAGNAKVKISGIGGYSGSRTITFKIVGKPLLDENSNIELSKDSYVYNGLECKPKVKLYYAGMLLKSGKDYTVKYENNINAGEAGAIVTGKGKYSGTITKSFTITPKQAKDASKITVSNISDQTYTGSVIVPKVTVTVDGTALVKGKDYTVSVLNSTRLTYIQNKKEKGTATMIITGIGNYKGTLAKKSFTVVKK